MRRWHDDPIAFVREEFQAEPDPWQAEALAALPHVNRLALKACKGPGKTAFLAWAILWFLVHARASSDRLRVDHGREPREQPLAGAGDLDCQVAVLPQHVHVDEDGRRSQVAPGHVVGAGALGRSRPTRNDRRTRSPGCTRRVRWRCSTRAAAFRKA
jgi:hypothetical protein